MRRTTLGWSIWARTAADVPSDVEGDDITRQVTLPGPNRPSSAGAESSLSIAIGRDVVAIVSLLVVGYVERSDRYRRTLCQIGEMRNDPGESGRNRRDDAVAAGGESGDREGDDGREDEEHRDGPFPDEVEEQADGDGAEGGEGVADALGHAGEVGGVVGIRGAQADRKSTRLNSSHVKISYAV